MNNTMPKPAFKKAQATEVLRFIVLRAGLYKYNSSHLQVIAKNAGIRPDALARYINHGVFSMKAANLLEKAVGRELLQWEWLVNPVVSAERGEIF